MTATRTRAGAGAVAPTALVPFLDALFLLLFALLALSDARTADPTREVHVELPAVEPDRLAPAVEPDRSLRIEIDASAEVRVAGEPARSLVDLDRALAGALATRIPEEVTIELVADRDARHGVAVAVLEHLRRAGFVDVRLVASGEIDADELLRGGGGR